MRAHIISAYFEKEFSMSKKKKQQWSDKSVNIMSGCQHDCRYCYAKEMACRFGQNTSHGWKNAVVRGKDVEKTHRKYEGIVMFPTAHDIHPDNLLEYKIVLKKLLDAGNAVLVVSKPHKDCIKELCEELINNKDKVEFRFTIGSIDNEVLKWWEPNAPGLQERLDCLEYATSCGYKTSVSCEPMLDDRIEELVDRVRPITTGKIWLGKANRFGQRLVVNGHDTSEDMARVDQLEAWQSDERILEVYNRYKNDPKIEWKTSIKEVVARSLS
jgi:DNA repair photolyase